MANCADSCAFQLRRDFQIDKGECKCRLLLSSTITYNRDTINRISVEEGRVIEENDGFDQFMLYQINQLPIRVEHIARETRKDAELGKILQTLEAGQSIARAGYKAPELNYSLTSNCLIYEHRVVVPPSLRQAILNDLHAAHIGIVKMKGLARSFVYWSGIDADIERITKSCSECVKHAHAPPKFNQHH